MTTIQLTIEGERPLSWNTIYAGTHWTVRRTIAHVCHTLVKIELAHIEEQPVFEFPVHIVMAVYFQKRAYDSCNITDKLYIDGLIKSESNPNGILPDDRPKYVLSATTVTRIDRKRPRVVLTVTDSIKAVIEQIEVER